MQSCWQESIQLCLCRSIWTLLINIFLISIFLFKIYETLLRLHYLTWYSWNTLASKFQNFLTKINLMVCKILSAHCLQSLPSKAYLQVSSGWQCDQCFRHCCIQFFSPILYLGPLGRTLQDVSSDLVKLTNHKKKEGLSRSSHYQWLSGPLCQVTS